MLAPKQWNITVLLIDGFMHSCSTRCSKQLVCNEQNCDSSNPACRYSILYCRDLKFI